MDHQAASVVHNQPAQEKRIAIGKDEKSDYFIGYIACGI
jgi:hypothetical protein